MNKPDLQQFARQLAAWTQLVIDNGRTPFRKVTLYTPLQTEQGQLNPPLIFWINRQSMMAGGLLLLPDLDLDRELECGRCCAEALGLRHFVTWETDRVRIWQLEKLQVRPYREFSIGPVDHPDSFRLLLNELLEALKLLAVLGMVPPAELSGHYLHNLFLATLELSFPPLLESCRSQRALDHDRPLDDAELRAMEINRLTLLQLLALLGHRQLPDAILPEKLSRAIALSLPKLPLPLQQALVRTGPAEAVELPYESSVCFHHLLLRLRQLNWKQPPERALTSIRLLIDGWYPVKDEPSPVQFYPQGPVLAETTHRILSDSATLLAAQSLLEDILQQPVRQQYFGNLFQFGALPLPEETITARLLNNRRPAREERHQYAALLRTSWPNRRFRIPGDKPLWLWETLHLLGLCAPRQKLQLTLQLTALQTPAGEPFWSLLRENFRIVELRQLADEQIRMQLYRGEGEEQPVDVYSSGGKRRLTPVSRGAFLRAQLLYALRLPDELFSLIDEEFVWPTEETVERIPLAGLKYYAQSRLGQQTWELLCNEPLPDSAVNLRQSLVETGWPVPDPELLAELETQLQSDEGLPAQSSIDRLLASLCQCPAVNAVEIVSTSPAATPEESRTAGDRELKREILEQLCVEGIPLFPEQYLYFLDNPETTHYSLAPPVKIVNQFLGQFDLIDAEGKIIQGYGEELSNALLLCGELGRQDIDLPADREQLAQILGYYRQDLRNLLQQLKRFCHSRFESSAAARKMANKIWKELQLPAEKWFAD